MSYIGQCHLLPWYCIGERAPGADCSVLELWHRALTKRHRWPLCETHRARHGHLPCHLPSRFPCCSLFHLLSFTSIGVHALHRPSLSPSLPPLLASPMLLLPPPPPAACRSCCVVVLGADTPVCGPAHLPRLPPLIIPGFPSVLLSSTPLLCRSHASTAALDPDWYHT